MSTCEATKLADTLSKSPIRGMRLTILSKVSKDKLDKKDEAVEFYRKAVAAPAHNAPAAYAVPFAKKKLGSLSS